MRKKPTSIAIKPDLFDWIQGKATQEDRSFNYIGERLIELGARSEGYSVGDTKPTTQRKPSKTTTDTPASNAELTEWISTNIERVAMDTSTQPLTAKDIYPAYQASGGSSTLNTFSKTLKASLQDVYVNAHGTAAYFVRLKAQ